MITAILITLFCTVLFILGIAFCIIPGIPGPPIAYAGLLAISIAGGWDIYDISTLIILGFITVLTLILDSVLPIVSAKRAGAGKAGIWASILGMVIGMLFFSPLGSVIGAFVGALAGEMIFNKKNKKPLKSAFAIFTGTILATLLKISATGIIGYFMVKGIIMLY